MCYANGL
jgi:hypothetical protein